MPDSTLSALTASTPGTAGLLYTVQGGADRKLSMTAAGAQMLEAANAAAQQVLLGITGGGAISLGGYTLTIPATGTAALLGTANVFTTLQTITQASANTGILASTGYSLTGSNATNMIDLAGTWNTSGTPTALKLRITNTASNAASLLFDFGTNAASLATLRIDGAMRLLKSYSATNYHIGDATGGISWSGGSSFFVNAGASFAAITSSEGLIISSSSASRGLRFINGNADAGAGDVFLGRKAAATLQMGEDAAGVTNQMFTAANRITSDGVGANLTIAPGNGRGAAGGDLIFSHWTTGGAGVVGTLTTSLTINVSGITASAKIIGSASTTSRATLNIPSGTAPSSPVDGDVWSDGSDLKVRLGGATYTLTKA